MLASGEHPFIIDVETLFLRSIPNIDGDDAVKASILTTGLLQEPPVAYEANNSSYVAAFQVPSSLECYEEAPVPLHDHTDQVRVCFQPKPSSDATGPPSALLLEQSGPIERDGIGNVVSRPTIKEYASEFITGYLAAMHRIKARLPAVKELFERDAAQLRARAVIRNTSFYVRLLWQLYQPENCATNGDGGSAHLRQALESVRLELIGSPEVQKAVCEVELHELLSLDVPLFYSSPGSSKLYTTCRELEPEAFAVACFTKRMEWITADDSIDHAVTFLKGLLARPLRPLVLSPTSYINLCREITDVTLAAVLAGDPFFLQQPDNLDGAIEDEISMTARLSLHDGLAGVLVYASAAGIALKEPRYQAAVFKVARALQQELAACNPLCTSVGGTYGLASVVFGLSYAAACWKDATLLRHGFEASLLVKAEHIVADRHLDIVKGAAGCALSLLALLNVDDALGVLTAEERATVEVKVSFCADRLLSTSINNLKEGNVLDWPTSFMTGFSHGPSGVCYALHRLGEHLKRPDLIYAAECGRRGEDQHLAVG